MLETLHLFRERKFLRDWIIATTLGLVAGSLLDWYVPRYALTAAQGLEHLMGLVIPNRGLGAVLLVLPSYVVATTRAGALIGLCLTGGQWAVLRRWKVVWAREWLAAGSVGAIAGYCLMAALHILEILIDPDPRILKGLADSGLWMGAIMGIAQWRVLQKHSHRAGWWVAASTGLWGVGATLNRFLGLMAARRIGQWLSFLFRAGLGGELVSGINFYTLGQLLVWIMGGVAGGLFTARVLARLVIESSNHAPTISRL